MQKFTTLEGIAAPLFMANVDTDMIIPKQFLKTIKRTGLAAGLFYDLRHDREGKKHGDFVLDRAPYDKAAILITGENFGCGSSREHAPWSLLDFGIRALIAPSFADIFYNNCFKNGILPVRLPAETVKRLAQEAQVSAQPVWRIDLPQQTVTSPSGETIPFELEQFRKHCLLNGLDDIGLTLKEEARIAAFEARQRAAQPWLYGA